MPSAHETARAWRRHEYRAEEEWSWLQLRDWNLTTHGFRSTLRDSLRWRLRVALRRQRDADDRLVHVHVGDGRDADAGRLDDVDGVDADARTDVARRGGVVPRHVGRDDGGDDAAVPGAHAAALPPRSRRSASRGGGEATASCAEGTQRRDETRLGALTAIAGAGYFFVWTVCGMAVFPLGAALAAIEMQQPALARAVPIAVGAVVLIAGFLQLTAWKARHLACCREASAFAREGGSASYGETSPRRPPAAEAGPGAAAHGRPTPAPPGDTACASASTAASAVPVRSAYSWSPGSWTFARWRSWRQPSPWNVSHRPVSTSREPSEPSPSGQVCF